MTASLSSAIAGGILIGLAASWLYLSIGRIAGISGIASRAISGIAARTSKGTSWPLLFIAGLGIGGWGATLLGASSAESTTILSANTTVVEPTIHWANLILGGVLVGYGTRLGSGCTSGHGVCGIARFSPRSLAATCVFLGTGMLVATTIPLLGPSISKAIGL